jgi:heptose I phosphotransferase
LDSFDRIVHFAHGQIMRQVPGRVTVRLDLDDGSTFYLKRHGPPAANARSAGRVEWRNILTLSALGIQCPVPVAMGCGKSQGQPRSFLITRAVPGGVPADDYLRRTFGCPARREKIAEKRCFIRDLALFAQQLHQAGFHHKDFYLCHVFVSETGAGKRSLYLIDLQRVSRSRLFAYRWIIKDLAALNYSATAEMVTTADRIRFLLHYLGLPRLTPTARKWIRAIQRKTGRIRRHDFKLQQRLAKPA